MNLIFRKRILVSEERSKNLSKTMGNKEWNLLKIPNHLKKINRRVAKNNKTLGNKLFFDRRTTSSNRPIILEAQSTSGKGKPLNRLGHLSDIHSRSFTRQNYVPKSLKEGRKQNNPDFLEYF